MPQSRSEEIANSIIHGLGLALSAAGAVVLLVFASRHGDLRVVAGCGIYSFCLVAVYAVSTVSHAVHSPRPKLFFATLDQAVIYLLIAGSFTPFAMEYLRGGRWWLLTATIWGVALLGSVSRILKPGRLGFAPLLIYVFLGWLPLVAIKPILEVVPVSACYWMLAGGISYTAGTVFLIYDKKVRYFHAVWHVFAMTGSACHYVAILFYVALRSG